MVECANAVGHRSRCNIRVSNGGQQIGSNCYFRCADQLVGFDGSASFAVAAQLKLVFGRGTFRGKYLLIDQNMGVIGRDILNLIPW